ncbi:hypothetical protein ACFWNG_16325 [Streptomyces sp. NPDC058391]|uniref:hypothetical protein n=1 Tax=Streptomyces sp. NPDC058391 TaxID=3346476 RepID=UPI00364A1E2B
MALNEKWAELFGHDSPGTGMNLASAATPVDGSGRGGSGGHDGRGGPDLKVGQGPWTTASAVANGLHTSSATALTDMNTASEGVTGATEGFTSTAALNEIRTSWKERLSAVRDECARLEGALKSAGKEFGEQETRTKQRFEGEGPK